ncbi:MAG: hypothetical protein ABS79_01800 [Planctomycetes bacterium SCN 63-9]|nr:MAG: hypothetical protein ABS79_01800 [Planctomycetes bacterium SCN 63-9]
MDSSVSDSNRKPFEDDRAGIEGHAPNEPNSSFDRISPDVCTNEPNSESQAQAPNEPNSESQAHVPNEPNSAQPGAEALGFCTNEPNFHARGILRNEPNLVSTGRRTSDVSSWCYSGWTILFVALFPALGAIWLTPWFTTQDGPAHVYNAEILARSFEADSPFRDFYEIHWRPLPNWTGHLLLAGLVRILPARWADLIATTFTMAGFAGSMIWLRRRVRGDRNPLGASLLAAILALNITWLFGFLSFLVGACLFPVILGLWWIRRNEPNFPLGRLAALMGLVVFAYFCHLVSLGLTALGLVTLAATTPNAGRPRWKQLAVTALILSPLLVLTPIYLSLSHREGGEPPFPVWHYLSSPWSPSAWITQAKWVDPISLMSNKVLPFTDRVSPLFAIFSPVLWLGLALLLWVAGEIRRMRREGGLDLTEGRELSPSSPSDRRGWWILAGLLLLGGYFGPDSFGPDHGEYLPQRLILLGLVALAPIFDPDPSTRLGRSSIAALTLALALQSLIVWDYAIDSGRTAGTFASAEARELVGRGRRVGTLLVQTRNRFRSNALLHADNWLGVGTGNIVWSNYETRYYYFPVHFKSGLKRPDPRTLEDLAITEAPDDQEKRAREWEQLLAENADAIDILVCWKESPLLDEVTRRWFNPAGGVGNLRIYRKKAGTGSTE